MTGLGEDHAAAIDLVCMEHERLKRLDSSHDLLAFAECTYGGYLRGELALHPAKKDSFLDRFGVSEAGTPVKYLAEVYVNYHLALKEAADDLERE